LNYHQHIKREERANLGVVCVTLFTCGVDGIDLNEEVAFSSSVAAT
jgi:hypothetical protein